MLCLILLLAVVPGNIAINDKVKKPNPHAEAQPVSISREFNNTEGVKPSLNKSTGELLISKWDEEVHLSIETMDKPESNWVEDGKEVLEYADYILKVYEIKVGMEYELIFNSKPKSNIFTFKIESKGLQFFHQPPLNELEWDKGYKVNETHAVDEEGKLDSYLPIENVGSYTVYGYKRGNKYKAGKFGVWYYPYVIDAGGNRQRAESFNISNGIMTITVNQTFLDDAVYPLSVDPSFGKTDVGAIASQSVTVGAKTNYTLTEQGIITNLMVYTNETGNAIAEIDAGYYNGTPTTSLVQRLNVSVPALYDDWVNVDVVDSLQASGDYGLAGKQKSPNLFFYYDTTGAVIWTQFDIGMLQADNLADPFPEDVPGARQYSIYAVYTLPATYYLNASNLVLSTLIQGENVTVSMDLETNSTPQFYWFGHNISGEWVNTTARAWTVNGTVFNWFWIYGIRFGVIGYANSSDAVNNTGISYFSVLPCAGGGGVAFTLSLILLIPMVAVIITVLGRRR